MSNNTSGGSGDSDFVTIVTVTLFSGVIVAVIGSALQPVQTWLVKAGVLVQGNAAMIHWGTPPVGFDIGRIVIALGAVIVLLVAFVAVALRRRSRMARER